MQNGTRRSMSLMECRRCGREFEDPRSKTGCKYSTLCDECIKKVLIEERNRKVFI